MQIHLKSLAALVVLSIALASPAAARMTYSDRRGDANAVNTQGERGFGHGGDVATAPASVANADITGVTFAKRVRDGRVWAYAVTVTVAGEVTNGMMFSVFAVTDDCDPLVVKHVRTAEGQTHTDLGTNCNGGRRVIADLPAPVVRGGRVTMTVPLRTLPAEISKGTVLREIYAYTVAVGPDVQPFLHAPKLDIASTRKTYRIGR